MISRTEREFLPAPCEPGLDRDAMPARDADAPSVLWSDVHAAVQDVLAGLDTCMRGATHAVEVQGGLTQGKHYLLFSYRTFASPGSTRDPIVAGLAFTAAPGGVAIEADASGEQTGNMVFSLPARIVPASHKAILEAARDLAAQLCQAGDAIMSALMSPSRNVE